MTNVRFRYESLSAVLIAIIFSCSYPSDVTAQQKCTTTLDCAQQSVEYAAKAEEAFKTLEDRFNKFENDFPTKILNSVEFVIRTSGRGAVPEEKRAKCNDGEALVGGSCVGFTSNYLSGIGPELEPVQNPADSEAPLHEIICHAANPQGNVAAMAICMRAKKH